MRALLLGNALLRVANAGGGALVGLYLAALARGGASVGSGTVGLLSGAAAGAEVLAAVALGLLAHRLSTRRLLVGGALLAALATGALGLTGIVTLLLVARVLEGVAAATAGPPLLVHLADATRGSTGRGRTMAGFELGLLLGLALGGLVAGELWATLGRGGFGVLAGIYLVAGALFRIGVPEGRPSERPLTPGDLRRTFADPNLRAIAPAWLAVSAIVGLWISQISFVLTGPRMAGQALPGAFDGRGVGLILSAYAVLIAVGVTVWGYAPARVSRRGALLVSTGAILVAAGLIWGLNRPGWAGHPSLVSLLVGLLVGAVLLESGFTPAGLSALADAADRTETRGATMAAYSLLLGLGAVGGAGLGGVVARAGSLDGLVFGTVGLTLVALASVARLRP